MSKIASSRRGVTPEDLAFLNKMRVGDPLRIGQPIKVPTQASRDAARAAKNTFLALDYYMRTHGGRLPPDPRHPPSLLQQYFAEQKWKEFKANGYGFAIDQSNRTMLADGDLVDQTGTRSRKNQSRAGGADRRTGDDGGHYIGVRFNGPSARFNHFAQDANFNRGAYRDLENQWARDLRQGHVVHVSIAPHYTGNSQRPDSLRVTWFVDGLRHTRSFPNHKRAQ